MEFLIFIVLVLLSAFFSASETAYFSLRDSEIHLLVREGKRRAELVRSLKSNPQLLLFAIIIGDNISDIGLASYATVVATRYFGTLGPGVATGVVTLVLLVFGKIYPKSFAYRYRRSFVLRAAYPLSIFFFVLRPAAAAFVWLEHKVQGGEKHGHSSVSEEEIRIMTELGLAQGEIDRQEQQMIERVFQFDDTPVISVMTPKEMIVALNADVPVERCAYYVAHTAYSRYPVYRGDPNAYIGYVHTNDVMRVLNSDDRARSLGDFVSSLTHVDSTMKLQDAFRLMTKERSHLFLVHEKKDPTTVVGLLTLEDILESIMGEIEDEGDRRSDKKVGQ